jgi:hypothetical protein
MNIHEKVKRTPIPKDLKELGFSKCGYSHGDFGVSLTYLCGIVSIANTDGKYFMVFTASDWYSYEVSNELTIKQIKGLIKILNAK